MKLVPTSISNLVARQGLQVQKSAPTILFGVGVAGMVGSAVLSSMATLKLDDTMNEVRYDLKRAEFARKTTKGEDTAELVAEEPRLLGLTITSAYTEEDYRRDRAVIYGQGMGKVLRLYTPALVLGAGSIVALTKSHAILTRRNAALTAAYFAVDEAFTRYRERVRAKYGEEQDREFRYGVEEVEYTRDNKIVTEKHPANLPSMYARFFDEYCTSWSKEPDYNYVFLHAQQQRANNMLIARGHMFLNEIYDMLGIDRTSAGSVVGWVVSKDGDNYIDFGIFKDARTSNEVREFINGRNNSILLDFNVDGVIYDKIDQNKERIAWQS